MVGGLKLNRDNSRFTTINQSNPGFTIGDLGKFGDELKKKAIPELTDMTKIMRFNVNYNHSLKGD